MFDGAAPLRRDSASAASSAVSVMRRAHAIAVEMPRERVCCMCQHGVTALLWYADKMLLPRLLLPSPRRYACYGAANT